MVKACGKFPHLFPWSNEVKRFTNRRFLRSQIALKKIFFPYLWMGNSYVAHIFPRHPFTFSLFAGAKNHTLFCSCYNPLLIFFYYHHKLCWGRKSEADWVEKNDCSDESSTSTEALLRKGLCFLFTRFAPPTVLVVSREIILLPFGSALLFYVNLVMNSFQRRVAKTMGKEMFAELFLLFVSRMTFFLFFLFFNIFARITTEMKSSCHQRRHQTNISCFCLQILSLLMSLLWKQAHERGIVQRRKSL